MYTIAPRESRLLLRLMYLYILSLPFFGFSLYNAGGRGLGRIDWLIGGLMLLVFLLASLGGHLKIIDSPAAALIAFYLCTGMLSAINIIGTAQTARFVDFATKALQLFIVTPLFFVISSLPVNEQEVQRLVRLWCFLGLAIALHTIYQLFAQLFNLPFVTLALNNPTVGELSTRVIFGYTQPASVFREPSFMAAFLAPPFILTGNFVLLKKANVLFFRRNWLNWMMVLLIGSAIILSGSQASLAAVLSTLLFMLIRGSVSRRRIVQLGLLAGLLLLLIALILDAAGGDFFTAFTYRLQYLLLNIRDPGNTAQVTSVADRLQGTMVGIEVWKRHPVFGIGLGNLQYFSGRQSTTNNPWVQLLVEQGLLGFISLLLVFLILIARLNQLARILPQHSFWQPLCVAMTAVLVLTMISGLFTFVWTHPYRILTLALANLILIQASHAHYSESNSQ